MPTHLCLPVLQQEAAADGKRSRCCSSVEACASSSKLPLMLVLCQLPRPKRRPSKKAAPNWLPSTLSHALHRMSTALSSHAVSPASHPRRSQAQAGNAAPSVYGGVTPC